MPEDLAAPLAQAASYALLPRLQSVLPLPEAVSPRSHPACSLQGRAAPPPVLCPSLGSPRLCSWLRVALSPSLPAPRGPTLISQAVLKSERMQVKGWGHSELGSGIAIRPALASQGRAPGAMGSKSGKQQGPSNAL